MWNKAIKPASDFLYLNFFPPQLTTTTESGHKPGRFAANYCASKQKYFGT